MRLRLRFLSSLAAAVTLAGLGAALAWGSSSPVCSLSGPTFSSRACDAPIALAAEGSRSGKSYSGLQNGSYTFTASHASTDGGTASASRRLTAGPARQVYWTNRGSGTIGRADLDGQNANQSFITGAADPQGVAVDSGHVYWPNLPSNTIGRADLDGQNANQSFITGAHFPSGVAVDADHIYWANLGSATIGRADRDGQNANPNFITGAQFPVGVAVDAGHIYWANDGTGTIGRADLDGQNANQSFITGIDQAEGVAVDSSHVYWTTGSGIGRADLDGQNANQNFITGASGPAGVAVDSSHVYWTNNTSGTIGRADLNGQNANQSFISGANDPWAVAVDPAPPAPPPTPPPPPPGPPPASPPGAGQPPSPPATAAVMGLGVARVSVFGRSGSRVRCRMRTGSIRACAVRLVVGGRVIARGRGASDQTGRRSLTVTLRQTARGRALLARHLGGVHARVRAQATTNAGARSAAARTRAILRVERFTTPPGSWTPDQASLTAHGRRFVRGLRGKLIAVASVRCDGYDADARASSTPTLRLSLARARTMCDALKTLGVRPRPKLVGHGDSEPIASNATTAGRAKNRRVEVTLTHRQRHP